ncbi:MAG: RHS repeat domain-containing protein [Blastocatellia bacterium]
MFRASRFTSSPIVRLTCLALCFALVLSGVSFAVSGRSKKKSGGGNPGSNSAAQRTQGPPSPNLPNLDAARRIKPAPPKAPNPVPATKCRRRDQACKRAKGETAINQPQFTNDGLDRLIARIENHSWSNRFTASEKAAGRDFGVPAVDALLDKPNRAVLDSPVGRSHRHDRNAANSKTTTAATPGLMLQTESDLAMALLDPNNRKGTPGEDLLSRNFHWSLPLLSLPGRAGLDLGFGISLNSLTWTRVGNTMQFDPDWGEPTPGFRLGFPRIPRFFFNPQAGVSAYLLILSSGRHVELRQTGTNIYEAFDSSYLHLTYNPSDATLTLRSTDGTQLKFEYQADEYKCTQIKDRNGNYITINYGAGFASDQISTIVDTLGRTITFNYDGYATVTSITQTWSGQTHTWATFAYGTQTIQTNFPGLTLSGASNGSVMSVLKRVGLADGSVYSFEYNTYCQVKTIRRYAPNTSNPASFPNDYFQRAYTTYNLPDNTGPAQSDCPRFTTRTDWAYEWNSGVTSTFAPATPNWAWGEVTMPDGTVYKETFATSGWQRGLTTQAETKSGGVAKKWTTFQWTQDNTGVSYRLNPRVFETNVYDDASNRRRTVISYTSYGLPIDVYEYEANATTVLRRTHTDYNLSALYTNRRIIGLPNARMLYDGGGSLFSKVEYYYDESGFVGPDRLLQSPPAVPIRHDGANYGNWQDGSCPSCIHERGNLTTVRRYNVVDSTYVGTKTGYHTTGSPYFTSDPLGHKTRISYQDSFSDLADQNTFAYPTTLTDADTYSSTIQYNYGHGAVTRTQDPKGAVFTRDYDTAGRLKQVTNKTIGAPSYNSHTEYVYAPNQYYAQSFTTINDLILNNRFYSITLFDGHDRVRATASDHPTSAGQYKARYNAYDVMGRLTQQSNQTEITAYWGPFGDDAAGWVWSYQAYDWQGRSTISTDQEGKTKEILYGGCGCAGGQVVVTRDEVGRRQKMIYDILGRLKTTQALFIQPKEQPLDGSGAVYSTTTNTYNVRDQVTNVNVKDDAAGVSQNTQMFYDGHGRLKERWAPIYLGNPQSATPYMSYEYYADDTLKKVIDPRLASATYDYNNRHLVTNIAYGGITTPAVSFGYDEAGNRTSMDDGLGNVTYHYDTLSRMDWERRYFNDLGQNYTLSYEYNLAGQLCLFGWSA